MRGCGFGAHFTVRECRARCARARAVSDSDFPLASSTTRPKQRKEGQLTIVVWAQTNHGAGSTHMHRKCISHSQLGAGYSSGRRARTSGSGRPVARHSSLRICLVYTLSTGAPTCTLTPTLSAGVAPDRRFSGYISQAARPGGRFSPGMTRRTRVVMSIFCFFRVIMELFFYPGCFEPISTPGLRRIIMNLFFFVGVIMKLFFCRGHYEPILFCRGHYETFPLLLLFLFTLTRVHAPGLCA